MNWFFLDEHSECISFNIEYCELITKNIQNAVFEFSIDSKLEKLKNAPVKYTIKIQLTDTCKGTMTMETNGYPRITTRIWRRREYDE